ncbi:SUMF1/EgtB/PvdO family nonheme iron enzyme [Rhodopseudomonas palustris]|uniref:SUMF1/EgtB/PvdO family nonheme iron enzyme n=1 Tax=Rhodopseudomonas palustris TaxID=1076 RepID=UPI0021F25DB4|nr:SUMF1/EgtB/PvdO family nonheme iron enzyme [Rhodopseudomonas palustris]UYO54602.1 SUMF1/EgtB/PvdO family nonheme iron enzyme [Rhodopseudomonas palustris]
MRSTRVVVALLSLLLGGGGVARAASRVALVVGNSTYDHVAFLPNPIKDAADISAALGRLGFSVTTLTNAKYDEMRRALIEFGRSATGAEMAVIFFAGHGIQMAGENWVIPKDATLATDLDVANEAIGLQSLMRAVSNTSKLGLVILDACRTNPFVPKMRSTNVARAVDRGFSRVEPANNILVAFAAKDGTTAQDGSGRNSPFTESLLKNIEKPDIEIEWLFRNVRDDVLVATKGGQEPFKYGSLSRESIYLKRSPSAANAPQFSPADGAAQAWTSVKETSSVAVLEDFVRRYGDTIYGTLARARLDELKKAQGGGGSWFSWGSNTKPTPSEPANSAPAPGPAVAVVAPPVVPARPSAGPCGSAPALVSLSARPAKPLSASEECALTPKDVFKECENCPAMVVVPPGSFTMGSPKTEEGRENNEGPQHRVVIGKAFAVGRTHVTVDEFAEFVAATGYKTRNCREWPRLKWAGSIFRAGADENERTWRNPGFEQSGTHPVVCVSWEDANAYVTWISQTTKKNYQLLTNAEWEYAARAGTTTKWISGADEKELCRHGNLADQTMKRAASDRNGLMVVRCSDGYAFTAPVMSYPKNQFGLHDMLGNAWQWTSDCSAHSGFPGDATRNCLYRNLRGGSWQSNPSNLRSARRFYAIQWLSYVDTGFRLGRTLTP